MVTRAKKEKTVEDLKAALSSSTMAIVSDYQGTSVSELTELRRHVQQAGGDFTISKNTLIRRAIKGSDFDGSLDEYLVGPTALAYTGDDPVGIAKALTEYIKKSKKTAIKGGVLDGKKISEKEISDLASLPSKEVLLGKLLGSMNAPAQNWVNVLSAVPRNLACVLEAIRKQKEEQG